MRDLKTVLAAMIAEIPDRVPARDDLEKILSALKWVPPELMMDGWNAVADVMCTLPGPNELNEWQVKVFDIFRDKTKL